MIGRDNKMLSDFTETQFLSSVVTEAARQLARSMTNFNHNFTNPTGVLARHRGLSTALPLAAGWKRPQNTPCMLNLVIYPPRFLILRGTQLFRTPLLRVDPIDPVLKRFVNTPLLSMVYPERGAAPDTFSLLTAPSPDPCNSQSSSHYFKPLHDGLNRGTLHDPSSHFSIYGPHSHLASVVATFPAAPFQPGYWSVYCSTYSTTIV